MTLPKVKKEPKKIVYPVVDPELLKIVYGIYEQWTAKEFSDAVAEYRRQVSDREARQDLELRLARLTALSQPIP